MSWVHEFQADTSEFLGDPCLPRRLLRHLIVAHGAGPGSRVLMVGCERPDVLRFLDRLGLAVTAIDESPERIEAARAAAPNVEFLCRRPDALSSAGLPRFDLVIAWSSIAAYRTNLFSPPALLATADLLGCLGSGGHFVVLARYDEQDECAAHEPHCFRRQLASFPGTVDDAEFPEATRPGESVRRMLGRQSPSGYLTATLSLSQDVAESWAWRRIAETTARSANDPCCSRCQNVTRDGSPRRSAA